MLFYKRVEPEEENGKDFSFDVSPDLLEVRHATLSGVAASVVTFTPSLSSLLVSFSGSGTTTCSSSRTKIYLNTPTSGEYLLRFPGGSGDLNTRTNPLW